MYFMGLYVLCNVDAKWVDKERHGSAVPLQRLTNRVFVDVTTELVQFIVISYYAFIVIAL